MDSPNPQIFFLLGRDGQLVIEQRMGNTFITGNYGCLQKNMYFCTHNDGKQYELLEFVL